MRQWSELFNNDFWERLSDDSQQAIKRGSWAVEKLCRDAIDTNPKCDPADVVTMVVGSLINRLSNVGLTDRELLLAALQDRQPRSLSGLTDESKTPIHV